jgi:D-alanyl-D-alanine carboxypeptidase/D-alanyl-D-alanine-endopeptidase (penicillin-binding protein 4)
MCILLRTVIIEEPSSYTMMAAETQKCEPVKAKRGIFYSGNALHPESVPSARPNFPASMALIKQKSNLLRIAAITFLCVCAAFTQSAPAPLLQNIQVVKPSPTPSLVQKTGSSSAAPAVVSQNAVRTLFPALAEVPVPGNSGILIESLDGNVVVETNSSQVFNPASNVKVATAYAIIKTFGPEFRFATNIYTDGAIDRATGTLHGNIYVSGKDPMFGFPHAITVADELNKLGIRSVMGDLIVTDNFAMNYSGSSLAAANSLYAAMDASRRSAAATRAWLNYLSYSGKFAQAGSIPSVTFTGAAYVQPIPSSLQLLFTHESAPIREILKATLCYSNNFLAERLGEMLGGPYAVARLVQLNASIPPVEFSIQTASGLGFNRVTPNAMMLLLRALRSELARYKMTYADIMPVAGIDKGTLEKRFDTDFAMGSVVGKTGTLGQTDAGVSSLSGEISTRTGRYLFVIFNQHGSVARFRTFQNYYISLVQGQFGGAQPMKYDPIPLETRLARTRVDYPNSRSMRLVSLNLGFDE